MNAMRKLLFLLVVLVMTSVVHAQAPSTLTWDGSYNVADRAEPPSPL